jgi:16S rRNA (cytosine967-C5)-methyltransferase
LIYSVCTLTRSETTAVTAAFNALHAELESLPLSLPGVAAAGSPASVSEIHLWPQDLNANGMFIAGWKRKKSS